MADKHDIVIVGSGSTAFAAALRAQSLGARVLMIEKSVLGGTCVNWGCIPSKTLIHAALFRREAGLWKVPASKQNRLQPHRGDMVRSGEGHAAPTELERIIGGAVAINVSLLRSWAWAGLRCICPRTKQ